MFVVDDDQLLMIGSADFESQSSFSVRLQAADRGGLFVVDSFQLNVEDINDSPSSITASTLFINADAPARSTVADITTNDQDSNDRHVLTLIDGSMDNHLFFLSGRRLKLIPNVDISDQDSYSVHLRSSDRSGESVDQILDFVVNHAPTDILASQLELLENLKAGEFVLSLATLDSDLDDQFVYSFAPGLGARDNDMFTLEGSDQLTLVPADFEEDNILQIRVRATDQNGLSVVKRFELSVQDVVLSLIHI